jgi:hypothetical protein
VSKRWSLAERTHFCFICLTKHNGKCEQKVCGIDGCTKMHHELLHKTFQNATVSTTLAPRKMKTILKMMSVQIRGPKATISVLAFLDEGSNITLLDSALAKEIGAVGELMPLCCNWMKGISHPETDSDQIRRPFRAPLSTVPMRP